MHLGGPERTRHAWQVTWWLNLHNPILRNEEIQVNRPRAVPSLSYCITMPNAFSCFQSVHSLWRLCTAPMAGRMWKMLI